MRTLVALVALLLTAGPAVADKVDPDTEIAQRHFARGRAAYDASRYAEAVLEFEEARRVLPLPALDFNIARCHDRMEHIDEAIRGYETYLARAPGAQDAEEVRERVRQLKRRIGATGATPQAGSQPPPALVVAAPDGRRASGRRGRGWVWGVVIGVAAAGGLAVGLGVGLAPRYPDASFGRVSGN